MAETNIWIVENNKSFIMTTIYLVDYIGVHCGMHYYLEAFKKVLSELHDTNVKILSNYATNDDEYGFFINHYRGSRIQKGFSLLKNLIRLIRYVYRHPDGVYIYLTYGNPIDLLFMNIIAKANRHLIDIHEAIAQDVDGNLTLKEKFKTLYSQKIKGVISHSTRTNNFLDEYGYKAIRLQVPHFKYVFPKDYDVNQISDDINNAPDESKINLLFFGNLNESKGIDILIEAVNLLPDDIADNLNVVIAGKDFDGAVDRVKPKSGRHVKIFRRHITDDELRFLYQNIDYMALPYRKTSQSGILEMSFYFKRPIIASDVTYFRNTLNEFPSFGILAGNSAESYAKTLANVIINHKSNHFYTDDDYARYENRAEIKDFISNLGSWIENS